MKKKRSTITRQFMLVILLIFLLQALMLAVIFNSFYKSSVNNIKDLGISNMKSQATMVENYLDKGGNVLWFATETMNHLIQKEASNEELLDYLQAQSEQMKGQFDENFTGIYGYLNETYLDGSGWVPPADYDPRERDWYKEALKGNGEMVMSSPYVDAETGRTIISFCQMLSDKKSVLALDIVLNEIQNITEKMTMGDMGYGFIVDADGLVIAHYDRKEVGQNYRIDPQYASLLSRVYAGGENGFDVMLNGELSTVFSTCIEKDWYVVIIANNALLYNNIRSQIMAGITLSILIFLIIVILSVFSIKRITKAEKSEQETLEQLQKTNLGMIRSLASVIDAKDRYTSGHSHRVAEYALMIAKRMGKSEEEQKIIYNAGLLHDIGKVRVPESVINKPGKLSEEEFDSIRIHPSSGFHILRDIQSDENIGYGVKYHHERYDGTGYPNGLENENIPEIARIIAVADAYDAMASDRSYRKALEQSEVRAEIIRGKGTQFDPKIADIMLQIMDEDTHYELKQKEETLSRIMVVDDDAISVKSVKHILHDIENISVVSAQNEIEAVELVDNIKPDLIIMDLKMPDTDGFSLYEKIRRSTDAPVILMSGDKSMETIKKIRELGITDYLSKPLIPSITKETVHGILQSSEHVKGYTQQDIMNHRPEGLFDL
ncbi:MAG: response regulator [Lachnospiraceae bacterium]|nr:response regulator [Lachnospiraceae bacterium]